MACNQFYFYLFFKKKTQQHQSLQCSASSQGCILELQFVVTLLEGADECHQDQVHVQFDVLRIKENPQKELKGGW